MDALDAIVEKNNEINTECNGSEKNEKKRLIAKDKVEIKTNGIVVEDGTKDTKDINSTNEKLQNDLKESLLSTCKADNEDEIPKKEEKENNSEEIQEDKENNPENTLGDGMIRNPVHEKESSPKDEKESSSINNTVDISEPGSSTMLEEKPSKEAKKEDKKLSKASDESSELSTLEVKMVAFQNWCKYNVLTSSEKVTLQFHGTSHRYGMMAASDIKRGETLFTIPRKLLLDASHGTLAGELKEYEVWLESLGRSMDDSSGWVPLLITLMHEFTKENSFWAPYLKLIPEISEFGHPLFWNVDEMKSELSGMALLYDLLEDRKNIEEEYKLFVLPFIIQNKNLSGSLEKFTMDLFKRMVAFVMAYSFTEDQDSPSMIPMADMLNHHSNNNAHLLFERDCLKMISCRKIDQGEEIFNTFGKLGNSELLQMYGYSEDDNSYNSFTIYVQTFIDVIEKSGRIPSSYLQAMVALLHNTEIAPTYDFFIFDKNGMRRGPDFIQFLRILHMPETEFEQVLKKRAGNRPDSFCQKLLRKLKLAKKTDTSSGVAVIDITEDENEPSSPEKRKFFQLEEIYDNESPNDETKRQCLYKSPSSGSGSSHFTPLDSENATSVLQNIPHFNHHGDTIEEPIVIDDESDDDDEERSEENLNIDHSAFENNEEKEDSENKDKTDSVIQKNEISSCTKNFSESNSNKDNDSPTDTCKEVPSSSSDVTCDKDEICKDKSPNNSIVTETCNEKEKEEEEESNTNIINDTNNEDEHTGDNSDIKSEKDPKDIVSSDSSTSSENKVNSSINNGPIITNDNVEESEVLKNSIDSNTVEEGVSHVIEDVGEEKHEGVEIMDEDSAEESEGDDDEIEIVSEDIGCAITYEKLKDILLPEWKETIKEVLNTQLSTMKNDDDVNDDKGKATRNQNNALVVRKGQRTLINTFLRWLA